jgi:hypothetical protein
MRTRFALPRRLRIPAVCAAVALAGGLLMTAVLPASAGTPGAVFTKTSAWPGGFVGNVAITNGGSTALSGWKAEFDLPSGTAASSPWNAAMAQSGSHYTFTNLSWNGSVAPGASVSFGFMGSGSGEPSNCTLNGVSCAGGSGPSPSPRPSPTASPKPDTTPPSVPKDVTVTGKTASSVSLAWTASTDDTSAVTYEVRRSGAPAVPTSENAATITELSASVAYSFTVVAKDAAGNTSAPSAAVSATTDPSGGGDAAWPPKNLAIGTVFEPFTGTDTFFAKTAPKFPAGKHLDYGYIYLNGGSQFPEWPSRVSRLANKSKAQGMTPIYIVYGIGGNSDSASAVWANLQSGSFLSDYFKGLRDTGTSASQIMGSGQVGYVIEPDTLGYLQQQYGPQYGNDPARMPAATKAVYDSGVLARGTDPAFPDTVTGLVQAVNYVLRKYTPKSFLGWQLNLWAAPGAPQKGVTHFLDSGDVATAKTNIADNAKANAGFAKKAGITSGADFVSIDKYGLDGAIAAGGPASDPGSSYWFWNADLWNGYLHFAKTLKQTLSLPVVLWQIPAGHINGTTHASPTDYNASGAFPDLANTVNSYEDSASTYFFGDTFSVTGARLSYFSQNRWADPKVIVSGGKVTWGSHLKDAADSGVVAILMGAGVGQSTRGVPQPGSVPESVPGDSYYWITRAQEYYASPVPIP